MALGDPIVVCPTGHLRSIDSRQGRPDRFSIEGLLHGYFLVMDLLHSGAQVDLVRGSYCFRRQVNDVGYALVNRFVFGVWVARRN